MGEKNEVNHDKKAFAAATSCEATINNTPKMKETFGVREWFSSLSEDDRIVALAFIDKSFLDTLSQVATHLSAIGGRNMTTDRRSTEVSLDWMAEIKLECILTDVTSMKNCNNEQTDDEVLVMSEEEIVEELVTPSEDTALKLELVDGSTNEQEEYDKKADTLGSGTRDPDVFRIKEDDEIGAADDIIISHGIEPTDNNRCDEKRILNEPTSSSEMAVSGSEDFTPTHCENNDQIIVFVDSVCIVSLSAFQQFTFVVSSDNDVTPIFSLHPSFLSQKTGEEALTAFDGIMSTGKFLSGPVCNTWNESLQSFVNDEATSAASIPLYLLLLLRFQYSILESYKACSGTFDANSSSLCHDSSTHIHTEEHMDEVEILDIQLGNQELDEKEDDLTQLIITTKNRGTEREILDEQVLSQFEAKGTSAVEGTRGQCYKDASFRLFKLLPLLFRRVASSGNDAHFRKIIVDVASYFGAMCAVRHTSSPKSIEDIVSQRILDNQVVVQTTNDPLESDGATDSTTAVVEEILDEDEAQKSVGETSNSERIYGGSQDSSDTASFGMVTGKKKNSRRKRRRKRRKDTTSMKSSNDANEQEMETIDERLAPVVETKDEAAAPSVEKMDEATNPWEARSFVNESPSRNENEIDLVASELETILSASIRSDKSDDEDSDDAVEPASQAKQIDSKAEGALIGVTGDPHICRVEDDSDVVVTSLTSVINNENDARLERQETTGTGLQPATSMNDDQDDWETVEVRSRGNRKKASERVINGRFSSLQSQNGNGSKRKTPRNPETRKRTAKRKMVREILFSVLDSVDEQVRRKKQIKQGNDQCIRHVPNAWGTSFPTSNKKPLYSGVIATDSSKTQQLRSQKKEGGTMRDVLVGKQLHNPTKASNSQQGSQRGQWERGRQRGVSEGTKKGREKNAIGSPSADQNTAPTHTETLSAVSTASAFTETPSTKNNIQPPGLARSESSSGESIEATKPTNNSKQITKEVSHSPPLPTLLSPCNANSATSSVASSLDAPHAVHHNHHSYPGSENDVGYHLLRVCDRLTRDISQFMRRREQALSVRRHERGLVLSALQDSLTTIWSAGCKVEMYGSCATDLDLPSSDLDVVVRGLEETEQSSIVSEGQGAENSNPEARTEEKQSAGSDVKSLQSVDKGKKQSPVRTNNLKHQFPMVYSHISTNAERVVTLAVELERQPWAVHVKAIPTASVPVIKILADPAKLQGVTVENDDWHLQQALIGQPSMDTAGNTNLSDSRSQYPVSPAHLTWRGADVVNGLLKVDITFEGPEHGGIGSTKFSKRVVEEFSEESSLPPDSTAAVQVLMVLKELLAQRRLNEPFSGGLSSYALLLLVISIVRERAIIRKELERVERQRRVVAAGGGNAVPTPVDNSIQRPGDESSSFIKKRGPMDTVTNINGKGEFHNASATKYTLDADIKLESSDSSPCRTIRKTANDEKNQCLGDGKWMKRSSGHDGIALNSGGSTSSSWASVARKTSPPPSKKASEGSSQSAASTDNRDTSLKKLGSFADVLTKGAVQGDQENKDTTVITSDLKLKGISPEDSGVPSGKGSAKMNVQDHSNQARKVASSLPVGAHAFEPSVSMGYSASFHTKQNASSVAEESGSFFPQSFHDVIEVLSSGEITPGKLLMHFLLFYGQHFDSHSTAIDYSNTHKRDSNGNSGYGVASPYMQRRNTGSYDPVTGMLTVDPIVVYDPLEGAELNNVARSCFAWSSIRWVFAQSYMTLSSAVEMSAGHIPGKGSSRGVHSPYASSSTPVIESHPSGQEDAVWGVPYGHDESGNIIFDPSTPLLELLLSF